MGNDNDKDKDNRAPNLKLIESSFQEVDEYFRIFDWHDENILGLEYIDKIYKENDRLKNKIRILSNLFYFTLIVYDFRYLNEFCLYCFMSKDKETSIFDKKSKYLSNIKFEENYDSLRKKYTNLIVDEINKGKIQNEFDLAKFFYDKDKCDHFYHENCLKNNNHRICYLCKYNFNIKNLITFFPKHKLYEKNLLEEDEKIAKNKGGICAYQKKKNKILSGQKKGILFTEKNLCEILYPLHSEGKPYKVKKRGKMIGFEKILIHKVRNFLMKKESIKEELRKKYIERISLCDKFRNEIDPFFYEYIKIDLNYTNMEAKKKEYEIFYKEGMKLRKKNIAAKCKTSLEAHKKNVFEEYREYLFEKYEDIIKGTNNLQYDFRKYIKKGCYFLTTVIILEPRYLNDYCVFCLKTSDGRSIFQKPENKEPPLQDIREKYKSEICGIINKSMIEDEIHLMNYYSKKCNHFYHEECKKRYHECYFCKYYIFPENLIIFKNIEKKCFLRILEDYHILTLVKDFAEKNYENILLESIKLFLKNEPLINEEIRKKYSERMELCDKFKDLKEFKYKTIKLSEDINEKKKIYDSLIKERERKKREEEERRREEEERRREEEEEERYYYTYRTEPEPYTIKEKLYLKLCFDCLSRCISCGNKHHSSLKTLYNHKECSPREKSFYRRCFVCKATGIQLYNRFGSHGCCFHCLNKVKKRECFFCKQKFYDEEFD